jgi:heptosyltransferase-2/heptosyltransferase-3
MKNPADFKMEAHRPYVFKSRLKTILMKSMDRIGNRWFSSPSKPIPWSGVKKVAVLRMDHIGDVLLALPCLEALTRQLPQAQVDFFVGPWSRDAAELSGLKVGVKIFSAPWFSKNTPKAWPLKSIQELSGRLQENHYDAVIDLRGDFRHILAMKFANIPIRIGQTRTGGGFLLTHPVIFNPELHEVDQNLSLLSQTGLETGAGNTTPRIFLRPEDEKEAERISHSLNLTRPVIALHATCAATAKQWPPENWRQLIEAIPSDFDIVMVGTVKEKNDMEKIIGGCPRKVVLTAGMFKLGELAAFLKRCQLFIGVDSGPAHIAAAVGTPVISLLSGTNLASQWSPRGPKVTVIQKVTPCSPCERTECAFNNECMREIMVGEVLNLVQSNLKGRF